MSHVLYGLPHKRASISTKIELVLRVVTDDQGSQCRQTAAKLRMILERICGEESQKYPLHKRSLRKHKRTLSMDETVLPEHPFLDEKHPLATPYDKPRAKRAVASKKNAMLFKITIQNIAIN